MDIEMRRNGSGKVSLEYRVSAMAETLGRLDGNERWPIIPVGRSDWERSIERIPGMKLASFSSRERAPDVVISVTLEYDNPEALIKFLDNSGSKASFAQGRLDIILNAPVSGEINADLLDLMRQVSNGYRVSVSFSADSNSTMTVTDGAGRERNPPSAAAVTPSGRRVSFSIDTGAIFELRDGLGVSFRW